MSDSIICLREGVLVWTLLNFNWLYRVNNLRDSLTRLGISIATNVPKAIVTTAIEAMAMLSAPGASTTGGSNTSMISGKYNKNIYCLDCRLSSPSTNEKRKIQIM